MGIVCGFIEYQKIRMLFPGQVALAKTICLRVSVANLNYLLTIIQGLSIADQGGHGAGGTLRRRKNRQAMLD